MKDSVRRVVYGSVLGVVVLSLVIAVSQGSYRLIPSVWHATADLRESYDQFVVSVGKWFDSPVSNLSVGNLITILLIVGILTRIGNKPKT